MAHTSPGITDLLIATLSSGRSTKTFRSILREREFKQCNRGTISVTLSRLHKKKYLQNSSSGWSLTAKGRQYVKKANTYIASPFKDNSPQTTIISFDIPEPDRALRNWLRNQIKIFGYKMLQQSLWVGPGPLPSSFLKRLEDMKIRENVKIFSRVQKPS